jgi:segregation and condensation protein B
MCRGAFSFCVRIFLLMSLKAKVEAVVYAAEEPVTLAQLAGIFSSEVLEELEAAAEQPEAAVSLDDGAAARPIEGVTEETDVRLFTPEQPEDGLAPDLEAGSQEAPETATSEADEKTSDEKTGDEKADEKKAAKLRDRRVREALQKILDELIADYAGGQRGMEIREIAGGYRMATKPEYHDAVRSFVKGMKPPMKLSLQALETLAVVAYKQPVTAPEVSEIRGVDSGGVLGSLLGRKLISTAGRKHVIGRPILYKTTKEFLLRFGLKDLNELPSMEEFEKMAGELAEAEAEAEDAAMRSALPLLDAEVAGGESAAEQVAVESQEAAGDEASDEAVQATAEDVVQVTAAEVAGGESAAEQVAVESQEAAGEEAVRATATEDLVQVSAEDVVPLAGSDLQQATGSENSDGTLISLGIAPSPPPGEGKPVEHEEAERDTNFPAKTQSQETGSLEEEESLEEDVEAKDEQGSK